MLGEMRGFIAQVKAIASECTSSHSIIHPSVVNLLL
jgi:hypothetical protein